MRDTYATFRCWKCQAENRVYVGDLEDLTLPDCSAATCYRCKVITQFPGFEDIDLEETVLGKGEPA